MCATPAGNNTKMPSSMGNQPTGLGYVFGENDVKTINPENCKTSDINEDAKKYWDATIGLTNTNNFLKSNSTYSSPFTHARGVGSDWLLPSKFDAVILWMAKKLIIELPGWDVQYFKYLGSDYMITSHAKTTVCLCAGVTPTGHLNDWFLSGCSLSQGQYGACVPCRYS